MQIGIVGAGKIGGSLAALFARHGHQVYLANSRGPESLTEQASSLGAAVTPATITDAVARSEVVVVAIPFGRYPELPATGFDGKIVIDTTNYYPPRDGHLGQLDAGTTTSSELLATHLAGARVVKAFNTIYFERLGTEGRPGAPDNEQLAIPLVGDDPVATAVAAGLIEQIGFAPVEHGDLAAGRHQQPGTPIYNVPANPNQARALLAQ